MHRIDGSKHSLYMPFIMIIRVLSDKKGHYISLRLARNDLIHTEVIGLEYKFPLILYPIEYVVLLRFVFILLSILVHQCNAFSNIVQGFFTGAGANTPWHSPAIDLDVHKSV